MALHLLGMISKASGKDGTCSQEGIESGMDRRLLLLSVLLVTWGITGIGLWSLFAHIVGHPASLSMMALKLLLTGTASLVLTWVLVLAAVLSLANRLRYRWPGSPPADLLLDPELCGSLLLAGVLGSGSLLLAWVRGLSYGEALGWLVLMLVTGVLVSALTRGTILRWRR